MIKIQEGIERPGKEFVDAVYELFEEYRDVYNREEWPRLESNEKMYRGDHWHDVKQTEANEPRPTTPIIQSTIENIRADLTDEFPKAVIKPEDIGDEVTAKIMTKIIAQNLEMCDYDSEYDQMTHDILVGGYMVQEVGWERATKSAYIRHVSNASFMVDPKCSNLQDSRAVFKFDHKPKDWFRQHYPKQFPDMVDDSTLVDEDHTDMGKTTRPDEKDRYLLIEAWFRFYDNGYKVHMVKLAGRQVLENSYDAKPEGYFRHGMYPFIITPLFQSKGTQLGYGIVDMFKNAQKYSDKLDQIMLINAFMAGRPKLLAAKGMVDIDDVRDYSKQVIETNGSPDQVAKWHDVPSLPSHTLAYMTYIRQSIKEESGANDYSRGNVTSGVTAATAITALQEMSTKRSRMEARRIHYGFKQAVRMNLEVEREFSFTPRVITITHRGEPVQVTVDESFYEKVTNPLLETNISIKTMRETKFTQLANNELMLEAVNIFGQSADPVIIFEGMEFDGKEILLEKLRAAQGKGILNLQQQLAQAQQIIEQLSKENGTQKQAIVSLQNAVIKEEA